MTSKCYIARLDPSLGMVRTYWNSDLKMTVNVTEDSHTLNKGAVFRWNTQNRGGDIFTHTYGVGTGPLGGLNTIGWLVAGVWAIPTWRMQSTANFSTRVNK